MSSDDSDPDVFDVNESTISSSSEESDENAFNSPSTVGRLTTKQVLANHDPAEREIIPAASSKEFAFRSLKAMGLDDVEIQSFTKGMGAKGFSALANFHIACEYFNLPLAWGAKQVKAFLIFINYKFYAASYVS